MSSKADKIRAAILANFKGDTTIREWKEIAKECDTTLNYVTKLVTQMRDKDLIPRNSRSEGMKGFNERQRRILEAQKRTIALKTEKYKKVPLPTGKLDRGEIDGLTKLSGSISRARRVQILSNIAENSNQDLSRITAVVKLDEMERQAGTNYGPPPPTTREDTVKLVVELLRSTRKEWVQEALNEYAAQTRPQSTTNEENLVETTASDSSLGGRD